MYLLLLLSSYSIPVASSTLVVVDLCCTAIVSHSVTVTVMLKRQRHSGSFFSCFTDSPECPQASLVSLSNTVVLLIPQSVLSASQYHLEMKIGTHQFSSPLNVSMSEKYDSI